MSGETSDVCDATVIGEVVVEEVKLFGTGEEDEVLSAEVRSVARCDLRNRVNLKISGGYFLPTPIDSVIRKISPLCLLSFSSHSLFLSGSPLSSQISS